MQHLSTKQVNHVIDLTLNSMMKGDKSYYDASSLIYVHIDQNHGNVNTEGVERIFQKMLSEGLIESVGKLHDNITSKGLTIMKGGGLTKNFLSKTTDSKALSLKEMDDVVSKILPLIGGTPNSDNSVELTELHLPDHHKGLDSFIKAIRILEYMESKKLIWLERNIGVVPMDATTEILPFGLEVLDKGGWFKYKKQLTDDADADAKIKELTIAQLKRNIFQIKYWWLFLLLSALLSAGITWLFDQLKS
jgi:hypothetical protein